MPLLFSNQILPLLSTDAIHIFIVFILCHADANIKKKTLCEQCHGFLPRQEIWKFSRGKIYIITETTILNEMRFQGIFILLQFTEIHIPFIL